MTAVGVVDGAVTHPVVVVGSLPPGGRDLDLLLRRADRAAVARALAAAGFAGGGSRWARFPPGGRPELVDLVSSVDLGLPPDAARELFAGAVPLPGCRWVGRPAPHHALLLVARSVEADGRLTGGRRERVAAAEAEDPAAWDRAGAAAPAWRLDRELDLLRRALAGEPVRRPPADRARDRARGVRRAGVVAVSGLDGSGKSTQARLLRDTLDAVGVVAVVEWNRLAHDRWLEAVARPVKRVARRTPAPRSDRGGAPPRLRSAWVVVVAAANALSHLRSVLGHRAAGEVVVCDRYVLDSVVHLRSEYAAGLGRRLAVGLVRLVSPRPRCAVLLDVPPEVLAARKRQRHPPSRLAERAARYREEAARLGVTVVDGTRPEAEVAAEVARLAWLALAAPRAGRARPGRPGRG